MCAAYGYKLSLNVLCGFDERIVARSANHFMQRGAGGDHGIDGILLLDKEIDQERTLALARGLYRWQHLAACTHRDAGNAVRVGKLDEIRTEDRRGLIVLLVEELLPLPHHAEVSVVDDGNVDVEVLLRDGGQLGGSHLKAAVSGDDPDFFL